MHPASWSTPVRFTAIMSSHISSVISCAGASEKMPALAMRMSIFPSSAMPRLTASSRSACLRTSPTTLTMRRSSASTCRTVSSKSACCAIGYATVSIWVSVSMMTTSAPSRAHVTACARPWPREPPVMRATFPSSIPMTRSSCLGARRTSPCERHDRPRPRHRGRRGESGLTRVRCGCLPGGAGRRRVPSLRSRRWSRRRRPR